MRSLILMILALCISNSFLTATAQDEPSLPQVLIIGDSTYTQHTRELNKVLKDKVKIVYATWNPGEIADTSTTIQLLDRHLGRIDRNGQPVEKEKWPRWDLVHFNCGLGDLIHRAPGVKAFRVMPIHVGGVRNVPVAKYQENLIQLVQSLKTKVPSAKIYWASTTPIRASATQVFELGSEIKYNQVAAAIMKRHGISINDMYTFVKHLINMDKPAGFGSDPFNFDKKPIHMPLVRLIEASFQLAPMPETEEEQVSKQNQLNENKSSESQKTVS